MSEPIAVTMNGTIQMFALSWVIAFLYHPIGWDVSFDDDEP